MKLHALLYVLGIFLMISSCEKNEPGEDSTALVDLNLHTEERGVMMQAFYWDLEPRGEWWNTVSPKLEGWKKMGVDRVWLPPVSKGMSGGYSMGYDPMDYFDLGEYEQMGTTETRFGSRAELENFITKAHASKIEVIADIVLNHNSGGELEFNPYRNKNTYTKFRPKSGRFFRTYEDYHPNKTHEKDAEALFFEEQDVCHDQANVQKWFWKSDSSVAKYYKNTLKFDGWRFDYVKGFDPSVVKAWMTEAGGFSVSEFWDGNPDALQNYSTQSTTNVFDFSTFYALEQALEGNNMTILKDRKTLIKSNAAKAVTFVTNHDTEKETNQSNRIGTKEAKMLAYAYILTHEGYPCIFYLDYEQQLDKAKLERLILINRSLARGKTGVLFADNEKYIASRTGDAKVPGLVVFINNSNVAQKQSVSTNWKNATLLDYSQNTSTVLKTDNTGRVTLEVPARSYTVWSLNKF